MWRVGCHKNVLVMSSRLSSRSARYVSRETFSLFPTPSPPARSLLAPLNTFPIGHVFAPLCPAKRVQSGVYLQVNKYTPPALRFHRDRAGPLVTENRLCVAKKKQQMSTLEPAYHVAVGCSVSVRTGQANFGPSRCVVRRVLGVGLVGLTCCAIVGDAEDRVWGRQVGQ